jgi:hypothetical protein
MTSTEAHTRQAIHQGVVVFLLLILSYPLFYFSYKYTLPDMGGADYFHYLHLYESWDVANTEAPFNMRIIGSYGTYLFNMAGLNYSTETAFAQAHPELSQQTFFNALLFNYLCVLMTAWVIYRTARFTGLTALHSFIGSLVFVSGFGTIFFLLKPANDACGVLLIALGFHFYLQRSKWIFLILAMCILQREYALMVFGMVAAVDWLFDRNRYQLWVGLGSVAAFGFYFLLRKTWFYSPLHDGQTKPGFFLQSLLHPEVDWAPFVKQLALSCNILLLYVLVVVYKKWTKQPCNKRFIWIIAVLFTQVVFMSIAAGFGNNTGRIFYFSIPVVIYVLLQESRTVVQKMGMGHT